MQCARTCGEANRIRGSMHLVHYYIHCTFCEMKMCFGCLYDCIVIDKPLSKKTGKQNIGSLQIAAISLRQRDQTNLPVGGLETSSESETDMKHKELKLEMCRSAPSQEHRNLYSLSYLSYARIAVSIPLESSLKDAPGAKIDRIFYEGVQAEFLQSGWSLSRTLNSWTAK